MVGGGGGDGDEKETSFVIVIVGDKVRGWVPPSSANNTKTK